MHQIEETELPQPHLSAEEPVPHPEPDEFETSPKPLTAVSRRRILLAIVAVVALGLTAVLPPLINVNRYQRRIVTSISASLGRPVHLDSVSLNILPMPGFTLTNFVVSEDPAFGDEPVIRANTVTATLRMRSLWHRRVEFSTIALDEPSVNLVHRADGRWNIESILLQASRMPVVPTAQGAVPGAQRFPYIEATGARVNLKQGLEKKPVSLLDAKFALWLAEPQMWRLRLEGHPTRTDMAPADTGLLRVSGTLGKAETLENVPIDLRGEWSAVPLGAASFLTLGRDAGVRGDMTLLVAAKGTAGSHDAVVRLQLRRLRRSDFVPSRTLDVDVNCKAQVEDFLHRFNDISCAWPPDAGQTGIGALTLTGSIPDVHRLESADLKAEFNNVPMNAATDLMRELSERVAPGLEAGGQLAGELTCCQATPAAKDMIQGTFTAQHTRLSFDNQPLRPAKDAEDTELLGTVSGRSITLDPIELNLGAPQPAVLTLQTSDAGLRMHLTGMAMRARLLAFAKALPQFGDGLERAISSAPFATSLAPAQHLEEPLKLDLIATRTWTGGQSWSPAPKPAPVKKKSRRR